MIRFFGEDDQGELSEDEYGLPEQTWGQSIEMIIYLESILEPYTT